MILKKAIVPKINNPFSFNLEIVSLLIKNVLSE